MNKTALIAYRLLVLSFLFMLVAAAFMIEEHLERIAAHLPPTEGELAAAKTSKERHELWARVPKVHFYSTQNVQVTNTVPTTLVSPAIVRIDDSQPVKTILTRAAPVILNEPIDVRIPHRIQIDDSYPIDVEVKNILPIDVRAR